MTLNENKFVFIGDFISACVKIVIYEREGCHVMGGGKFKGFRSIVMV